MDISGSNAFAETVGTRLRQQRELLHITQAMVAVQAGISTGYYSCIENSKCPPPRKGILRRLLETLKVSEAEVVAIERQAGVERGMSPEDGQLPEEAQVLIADIRRYANAVPPRFLKGMRTKLREVAL